MGNRRATNTLLLAATNVFNRAIGFAYRIVLIRVAGREAVGLWQMMIPSYFLFRVLASAGLTTATTRLIAESRAKGGQAAVGQVFRTAILVALGFGLTANALLFLLSGFLAQQVLGDPRTTLAFLIIAPSLPLMALSAVFRGYFQGIEEMKVVSTSLILEEIVYIASTLALIAYTHNRGPGLLIAGLAAGSVLGELVGLGVYLVFYPWFRPRAYGLQAISSQALRGIFHISLPATGSRLLNSLSQVTQSIIIPSRLRAVGWTATQAAVAYGELTGMALNLLFIPSLFTVAMATALLPQVTAAVSRNNWEQAKLVFLRTLNWTAFLSLPAAALFISLGEPLCQLVFGSPYAGRLLALLAWGGLLLYTQQIATATLQGLGKPNLPLLTSVIGTLGSACLLFTLTPIWQIKGAAIGLVGGWALTGALSLLLVQIYLRYWQEFWPWLVRVILAAIMCGYTAKTIYWHLLANSGVVWLSLLGAGLGAAIIYLLVTASSLRRHLAPK
ncbi:MAG: polysaccharide biosynthesis protein [Firmicutes bacterium]|nr:polysaccharide biosynthesis protein [Bacillota bacterium]